MHAFFPHPAQPRRTPPQTSPPHTHASCFDTPSHRPPPLQRYRHFRCSGPQLDPLTAHYQIIRRNGAVVYRSAEQDRSGDDEGVPGGARHPGRRLGQRARGGGHDSERGSCPDALASGGGTFHIEDVQDQVELGLMRGGHHEVARAYVLYRERRAQERAHGTGRSRHPAVMHACATTASECRWTLRLHR